MECGTIAACHLRKEDKMAPWKVSTEPFLFIYLFVLGVNLTLLPQLTTSKVCRQKYNTSVCNSLGEKKYFHEENDVYNSATKWNTIMFAITYIHSAITILPFGAISDQMCKKKVLFVPTVIQFLQSIALLLCSKFFDLHVGFLVLAVSFTSIHGDEQGAIMLSYLYMSSVTSEHRTRMVRMALLGGCTFAALGFGSFVAGILVQNFSFVAGFAMAVAAAFLNILFVACILPAVPPPEKLQQIKFADQTFCEYLMTGIGPAWIKLYQFMKKYVLKPNGKVLALLTVLFFATSAVMGEDIILTLFLKHSPLNLSSEQIGSYFLAFNFARGFGVIIIAIIASKCIQLPDYALIIIGLLSLIAGHLSLSFASNIQMLYAFTSFSFASPLATASTRAMLTKHIAKEEIGTALSFGAVLNLAGITVMLFETNTLFRATASIFPGFSILVLALSSSVALLVACCFLRQQWNS